MFLPYGEETKMSKELAAGHSLLSTTGRADSVDLIELSGNCGPYEDAPHDIRPPLPVWGGGFVKTRSYRGFMTRS